MEEVARRIITNLFGQSTAMDLKPFMGIIGFALLCFVMFWFNKSSSKE